MAVVPDAPEAAVHLQAAYSARRTLPRSATSTRSLTGKPWAFSRPVIE
jgi:hypothetical protein